MSLRVPTLIVVSVVLASQLSGCFGEPDVPAAPPQMHRLTEAQYRQSIADTFGRSISVVGRFEPDARVDGLVAVGTGLVSVTPGGMEQYEGIAREVARQVVAPDNRERLVECGPSTTDPEGRLCAQQFFKRVGLRLYRRPLAEAELSQLVNVSALASTQLGDYYAGLAAALTGMLSAPDFLFRIDHLAPSSGAARLDSWSKAARLSYFLWNASPDDELLKAAQDGELDSSRGLEHQVDRMMSAPRYTEGLRAFFDDFLQLDGVDTLSKDSTIYPAFVAASAADAREQTLESVADLLVTRRGDYRDLFTDRRLPINRRLGPLYDVPVSGKDWSVHEFPAGDPRGGLLTQVSFLALNSHPGRTSPTLRGKAIREIMMCQKIPKPPANVNFAVVQDVSNPVLRTARARLQAHVTDPECASCHRLTDPIGLGLEQFDGVGEYRAAENGTAIDASGALGDARFADAAGLGKVLHDDPAVPSCMVRTVWRYAMGRDVQPKEEQFLQYLDKRFASDRYRVPDLMRRIATSRTFYSVGPSTAVAADGDAKGNS